MTPRLACFVACALLIAQRSDAGVATVFADNFLAGSKQVVTYPAGNPSSPTLVGPQADTFSGMDFDANARLLWAIDFTAQSIGIVNQSDGSYAAMAALQAPCCFALTIDPLSGRFYGSKDSAIYAMNPKTGEGTQVSAIAGTAITALAIDCAGNKFAMAVDGLGSAALYRWHLDSGSTLVGASSYAGPTSLEFDNQTGTLYAWFNATGQTSSWHVTVDPATGMESAPSSIEGKFRMAVRNTCPEHIFSDDYEA